MWGRGPHKGACKGENTDWASRDEAWEEEQLSTRRELSKKLLKVLTSSLSTACMACSLQDPATRDGCRVEMDHSLLKRRDSRPPRET